ncbi:MAG: hypothetical protein D6719_09765 [Candidatus Dadabacteria bacterium]|nr:MAG: hypothetical protein D6719_09765 [Candidatus Dadabacteria bacterium]
MKRDELITLIVDQQAHLAEELTEALKPEVELDEIDFTTSVHRAIQSHIQVDYNVCFISDKFPMEDLETFFRDFKKLEKKNDPPCVFVQVKEKLDEKFDPEPFKKLGFSAFITRKGTHADKEALMEALKDFFHEHEIKTRTFNAARALNIWLSEIDRVARDKRRGKEAKLNTIAAEGISRETQYDEEVLNNYFRELEKKLENATPEESSHINVPDEVLKKDLPHLEKDKYSGASSRVWSKLLQKHGVKDLKAHQESASEESEPTASEAAAQEAEPPAEEDITGNTENPVESVQEPQAKEDSTGAQEPAAASE